MKWVFGIFSLFFAVLAVNPDQKLEARYRRVESYEIRPDILATPSYAKNGALCKVSIEKRHVQASAVDMSATIPREVSIEIIDELAPPAERGQRSSVSSPFAYDIINGSLAVLPIVYENVSVEIYRNTSNYGDTAVILTWKNACGSSQESKEK